MLNPTKGSRSARPDACKKKNAASRITTKGCAGELND